MSDDEEIHEGAEGFKEWAETQVTQQQKLYESMLDQHSALYRWILAARLSVNGGAAIAILNADQIDPKSALISLMLFVVGVLSAILAAEFDQKSLQAGFGPNALITGFWSKARVTGQFNATRLAEFGQASAAAAKECVAGKRAGWLSIIAFVLGVAVSGASLQVCPGVNLLCSQPHGAAQ
jgi:hypothetical protein